MCPAHRDLPTPPTLTLSSTFRIQYHHIPITASRLFHSQHPFRPFSSIGSAFRPQHRRIHITASNLFSLSTTLQAVLLHRLSLPSSSPSHTYNGLKSFFTLNSPFRPFSSIGSAFHIQYRRIQTQVNKTPALHNQALLKKARGVCRGAAALRPLCGFPFSSKKILHAIRQKSKRHTVF